MSQQSRATYKTIWSDAAGTFADNSTRQITESNVRDFADDSADSTVFKSDDYDYFIQNATASGTDTYTITPTIPAAYTSGERFLVTFTNANTGAATLNRNSLGAKDLKSVSGAALSAGQIPAGGKFMVSYTGVYYQVLGLDASGTIGGSTGATDNRLLRADGTGGSTLQANNNVSLDDSGNITGVTQITATVGVFTTLAGVNTLQTGGAGGVSVCNSSIATSVRRLTVEEQGSTDVIMYPLKFGSIRSTGSPGVGIGTGMEMYVETTDNNYEIGATIETVTTDVSAGSEDFDLVIKTMSAGAAAAERLRITSLGLPVFNSTVTGGGTTGNQTIDKASGTVNFAAAATTLTVTNSLVTASSIVFAVVRTNDTTATIKNVVPASGSFVITLAAAATAETSVGFFVINQ